MKPMSLILILGLALLAVAARRGAGRAHGRHLGADRAGRITLDGVLNEAAWAQAESRVIEYGQDAGHSRQRLEDPRPAGPPVDPTHATLKFLVHGNQLYMGAEVAGQVRRRQQRSSTASTAS